MKRYFLDSFQGRTNNFIVEPDGSITIDTIEDVAPILEANKRQLNDFGKLMPGKMGTMHHAARIPPTVMERWMQETGLSYSEFWKDTRLWRKYLNDPDNKFLRTSPTRI